MMSLVSTPVVAARVTAKKHAVRKTTIASASKPESSSVAQKAVAATIALSFVAQPAFADDASKKEAAAALAAQMAGDLQAKKGVVMDTAPKKVKQLAAPTSFPSLSGPKISSGAPKAKKEKSAGPSFSLPSFSLPSLPGGGEKKAAAPKAAAAPKPAGGEVTIGGGLGPIMLVLFSPLIAVGAFSVQTLLRVVPQAAEGKEFFPKDTMPF
jgi:hypothetical protein